MWRRLQSVVRVLLGRRRFERGMTDELQFHVDAYTADLRRDGLAPEEALRRARAAFGGVDAVRDECRRARGLRWWDELGQDVRYALRLMRRTPAFTAAAILSLGLGIGANTAIFSLIDAILLRSLAVSNPQELFFLAHGEGDEPSTSSNYPLLERYRTVTAFSGVTAFRMTTFTLGGESGAERVAGQFVSGNYHRVVGAPFVLGRGFVSESDRPTGDEDVAVISEGYWVRRFGRAPDVLSRTLTLQGRPVTIVGVTAGAFGGFMLGTPVDITLPLARYVRDNPKYLEAADGFTSMPIVARLRTGVPEAQALGAADVAFQQFMLEPAVQWARKFDASAYATARLETAGKGEHRLRRQYRTPLLVLMGMAALVLLVASANIANLLLSRSTGRAREIAVRLCVGGGRSRLVRQLLTESAVLALAGGALGIALAFWGTGLIVWLFGSWYNPLILDVSPNLRVLAFTSAVAIATGLAFGIGPALRVTRVDLTPALKEGERAFGAGDYRSVLSRALIVAQVALCVVAVATSALLGQSVRNLKARPAGFDASNVVLFDLLMDRTGLAQADRRSLNNEVLERLRVVPGVDSASISTMTPVNPSGTYRGLVLQGSPETPDARGVYWNQVSKDFFRTTGVRVLRGRPFDDSDISATRKVAILNARTARYVFGDANPIGHTIAWMASPGQPIEVIGVVEDTSHQNLREEAPRMVYTPLSIDVPHPGQIQVAVKTTGDPSVIEANARAVVRSVSPDVVIDRIRTMDEQVNASLVRERGLAWLSAGFAALASILACVGLYGVMSYQVARRTREIGIRLAIGAPPRAVLGAVLGQTGVLALTGIALGLVGAWFATGVVATFLYGLSPRDPLTLAGVSLALGVTTLAAGYLPARRAARIDPLRAIRTE